MELEEEKEPKKRVPIVVPQRPRSPKTDEQIREKIYRKMAGRKKNAATAASGGKARGGSGSGSAAAATSAHSKDREARVQSSRPK